MKKTIVLYILICNTLLINAQNYNCSSDLMNDKAYNLYPNYKKSYKELRTFGDKYLTNTFIPAKGKTAAQYKIPIVFHVIHQYGPENVSDSVILEALQDMNDHWRKRDADTTLIVKQFKSIHEDMDIEFVLAKLDPEGNCTNGITRTVSDLTYNSQDAVKALVDWPCNKYLNVWIVSSPSQGVGGYSYYPGIPCHIDGIVVRGSQLSALAHEAGHWLALPHPWGNSNSPNQNGANCSIDDGISDTPNCDGGTVGCDTTRKTCLTDPVPFLSIYGVILQDTGQIIDAVQNYMDYAFCNLLNKGEFFSQGQKALCHASLNSSISGRNNLWTPANLIATGTNDSYTCNSIPIADFGTTNRYGCTSSDISLVNNSYNSSVLNYKWVFENGTPATSTDKNPTVRWSEAGGYDITLIVSNNYGADTLTKKSLIIISDNSPTIAAPFYESFESTTFPIVSTNKNLNWIIENEEDGWKHAPNISSDLSHSVMIDIKVTNGIHRLFSPTFDFTNNNCDTLTFDLAYARKDNSSNDNLSVYASKSCGKAWKDLGYHKYGSSLETHYYVPNGDFIPTSLDWRKESIDLSYFSNKSKVMIMFEVETGGGNSLYIDNVNLGCSLSSINHKSKIKISISPNPFTDDTYIVSETRLDDVQITITDLTGKSLVSKHFNKLDRISLKNDLNITLKEGFYLVKIVNGFESKTIKIIKK